MRISRGFTISLAAWINQQDPQIHSEVLLYTSVTQI